MIVPLGPNRRRRQRPHPAPAPEPVGPPRKRQPPEPAPKPSLPPARERHDPEHPNELPLQLRFVVEAGGPRCCSFCGKTGAVLVWR